MACQKGCEPFRLCRRDKAARALHAKTAGRRWALLPYFGHTQASRTAYGVVILNSYS